MSYPEYANWVPLPAPVTTGTTIQSFIAPDGEEERRGVWYLAASQPSAQGQSGS
jgi:hypothetical protein